MLALAYVFRFLAHEFARLRRWRKTFALVFARPFECFLFRHSSVIFQNNYALRGFGGCYSIRLTGGSQQRPHQCEVTRREARNVMCWRDYLGKEVKHVRLGRNISNNRHHSSGIGIWRDRRGVGGNCQVPIPSIPGDVHYLCDFRMERQRSSLINGTARFDSVQTEKRDFSSVRFLFA
jgi:hypothetical protein